MGEEEEQEKEEEKEDEKEVHDLAPREISPALSLPLPCLNMPTCLAFVPPY